MKDNSLKLGGFELTPLSDGTFWLDGGAMFGVVPKILWNKLNPADEFNRIELALNTLLIQTGRENVLVDTGIGAKVNAKLTEMYRFERTETLIDSLKRCGLDVNDIDYVINTHLHFDHCGGNTVFLSNNSSPLVGEGKAGGKYVPTFPRAKYIIQKQEWQDATHPNDRTKASYLKENYSSIEETGQLNLAEGDLKVVAGIKVIKTCGHTSGHQSVLIESEGKKAIYLGDLMPTTSHFKIPYVMGYDLYPLDIMETKKKIIDQAINEKWLFIFEHDPKVIFAHVLEQDGKKVLQPLQSENSKNQISNSKQIPINQVQSTKQYDLAERTLRFSKDVIEFVKIIPRTQANTVNSRQLTRSSGSIGANYVEANEALGKKDFFMRIRICKKESKESAYWLQLLECNSQECLIRRNILMDEALQFVKIFNSIAQKSKAK